MKILLIACSYPPDPVVGSFRAAKVAHALRDAGHHVDVITSALPDEVPGLRVDETGLRVHAVREVSGPRTLYRRFMQWVRSRRAGAETFNGKDSRSPLRASTTTPSSGPRPVPRWKRYLLSVIWVPDNRQGFIPAALRRARPLMDGVDFVYTTAPPFSDHLVGLALKRRTGVRWAAEFRDPWIENANRHSHLRSKPMEALNRAFERRCIAAADQLIAVSEGTAALLRTKLPPHEQDKVILALNGIDNLVPADEIGRDGQGPVRIAHIGNCYGTRDPRLFLRALANVVHRHGMGDSDVRVEFIGHCRMYRGESLEEMVAELGIAHLVEFADWIPQPEARARARRADLFLLPFPHERGIIPNKLFDYLGLRKPVLGFVHPDGEAARILQRLGGHFLVTTQSLAAAEHGIDVALREARETVANRSREALLHELTTDRQMERLVAALGLTPTG